MTHLAQANGVGVVDDASFEYLHFYFPIHVQVCVSQSHSEQMWKNGNGIATFCRSVVVTIRADVVRRRSFTVVNPHTTIIYCLIPVENTGRHSRSMRLQMYTLVHEHAHHKYNADLIPKHTPSVAIAWTQCKGAPPRGWWGWFGWGGSKWWGPDKTMHDIAYDTTPLLGRVTVTLCDLSVMSTHCQLFVRTLCRMATGIPFRCELLGILGSNLPDTRMRHTTATTLWQI